MNPYTNEIARHIYDAFVEGWGSYASPCCSYNTPEEAWAESHIQIIADSYENS